MKVGLVSTPWLRVPPVGYGGIENVIYDLILGARKESLDIDFYLFSLGDTARYFEMEKLEIEIGYLFEEGLYNEHITNPDTKPWIEAAHTLAAWQWLESQGVDLIHDHNSTGFSTIAVAKKIRSPVLITLHGPPERDFVENYRKLPKDVSRVYLNSISDSQRKEIELPIIGTVYNGIDVEKFPYQEKKEDFLFIIGRITPVKGQDKAIKVAKILGKKLIIAGEPERTMEGERFWHQILPHIDYHVEKNRDPLLSTFRLLRDGDGGGTVYFGQANFQQKIELYRRASCVLMPINWEEPFGLVMIEAMACGTPVVAFKRGAAPEIIEDGKTGFLVDDLEEMIEAVDNIHQISPRDCRNRVEEKFSDRTMARGYYLLYQKILEIEKEV